MSVNDITGDKLKSKVGNTQAYSDGYDAIFGKKKKTVNLYDLPRYSLFTMDGVEGVFELDHIDGMYSVCFKQGEVQEGNIYHIAAFQEVIPVDKE